MKRKSADGVTASHLVSPAANENFAATDALPTDVYPRPGWDPYEVWRTRVKASSQTKPEHERDPLRQ
jgi:hypothetical protein